MVPRAETSPALERAITQMTAVMRDFIEDTAIPEELVQFATQQGIRTLRDHGWALAHTLRHLERLVAVQCALLRTRALEERCRWLRAELPGWASSCFAEEAASGRPDAVR